MSHLIFIVMKQMFLVLFVIITACDNHNGQNKNIPSMSENNEKEYTNSLIKETSPYLLQHAHNPVNWYAWGDEAFKKAKEEDKLVLISIGYSSCHWCHVMEHESFEDEAIAKIMNEHFVCIKVDREERSDVDQIYMSAVQLMTGSGGWPLNCFALSDGRPVYGGTYFRPQQWKQVLLGLAETYNTDKAKIENAAKELTNGIANNDLITVKSPLKEFKEEEVIQMVNNWKPSFDKEWGGAKRAPKFPMPTSLEFLLRYAYHSNDKAIQEHLNLTLTKIANGGIYDQIGGGFARYSVDGFWKVPHFEKMLYDNGQLISLYAKAYKYSGHKLYKEVIEETLQFIEREMTNKEGVFYSSYDADSEGVEGKYYVWKKAEIEKILGKDAIWFCDLYNIKENGNWEGENIPWITNPEIIKKHELSAKDLSSAKSKLLKERVKRIPPGLDDKILTSWNALMGIGYIDAFEALGNEKYKDIALKNGHFIFNTMIKKDGSLLRNYKNGIANISGFLDDYALTIQLFTRLYQITFNYEWLKRANDLTAFVNEHFNDSKSDMYFYTSDINSDLIARKMELSDNVIPASNSVMAHNLFNIGTLINNETYINRSKQMLFNMYESTKQDTAYYANWASLMCKFVYPNYEVVIAGEKALELKSDLELKYLPNITIAGIIEENETNCSLTENRWVNNKTLVYVCEGRVCKLPVESTKKAIMQIKGDKE